MGGSVQCHVAAPAPCWPRHPLGRAALGLPEGALVALWHPWPGCWGTPTGGSHGADGHVSPRTWSPRGQLDPGRFGLLLWPCLGRAWGGAASGFSCQPCKDSCHRPVPPSVTDAAFPNSEQLWPSAPWRKETVPCVRAAEHPRGSAPLSSVLCSKPVYIVA